MCSYHSGQDADQGRQEETVDCIFTLPSTLSINKSLVFTYSPISLSSSLCRSQRTWKCRQISSGDGSRCQPHGKCLSAVEVYVGLTQGNGWKIIWEQWKYCVFESCSRSLMMQISFQFVLRREGGREGGGGGFTFLIDVAEFYNFSETLNFPARVFHFCAFLFFGAIFTMGSFRSLLFVFQTDAGTALHAAALFGRLDVVRDLLEAGKRMFECDGCRYDELWQLFSSQRRPFLSACFSLVTIFPSSTSLRISNTLHDTGQDCEVNSWVVSCHPTDPRDSLIELGTE